MIHNPISRRPRTVDTTHKALVAFAAGVLLCLQPVKAAIVGGTNILEHVPYSTLMWSAADPFGFGAISNLQGAAGLTPQDVTNAVTYNLIPYASHTSNPAIHTTPATVTNIAQYLLLPYSTTADLLGLSNVLSAVDAVLQTGKVSQASWVSGSNSFEASIAVLSTQRVTRVWSADGSMFAETGVVWQVASATNYTVAFSPDLRFYFEGVYNEVPPWQAHSWPFLDMGWSGTNSTESGLFNLEYVGYASWTNAYSAEYPVTLFGAIANGSSEGTAVVSQFISTVYSPVKAYAIQADLSAVSGQVVNVKTDLTTHISTNAASVIAQAQPSTLMRYADFAVTNTAGFAAFTNANPAQKTRIISSPTLGTSLAKARWPVTSTLAGTLSVSAYVQSGLFTPPAANCAAYVVLSLYTAGGVVVASNIGATVSIDKGAVSNISATVALAAPATNGYVVAEVFSGTNAVSVVGAIAGGSYPFILSGMNTPLNYLVESKADSKYVTINNGTLVNPEVSGTLSSHDNSVFGGTVDMVASTVTIQDAVQTNSPVTLHQLIDSLSVYTTWQLWGGSNSTILAGAKAMRTIDQGMPAPATNAVSVASNSQYIAYCSLPAGLTSLKAGLYEAKATMWRSDVALDALSISAELYIRQTNGTLTEVTTASGTSPQALSSTPLEYVYSLHIDTNTAMNATDSLVLRFKSSSGAGYPVTAYITQGFLSVPIPSSQFVLKSEVGWLRGVLNGTNGTYSVDGTNTFWILKPTP